MASGERSIPSRTSSGRSAWYSRGPRSGHEHPHRCRVPEPGPVPGAGLRLQQAERRRLPQGDRQHAAPPGDRQDRLHRRHRGRGPALPRQLEEEDRAVRHRRQDRRRAQGLQPGAGAEARARSDEMIAARAVAVGVALAAAGPAAAAPAVVAVVNADAADVRAAVLVGPSAELYEPDRQGAWTRKSGGGIAAEVVAAVQAGDAVYAAGETTPLYRRRDGMWAAVRFGERGRPLVGRGPVPSV